MGPSGCAVLQRQPRAGTSQSPQPEEPPDCIRKGSTISGGEGQLPALLQHLHLCFPALPMPRPIWSPGQNCEIGWWEIRNHSTSQLTLLLSCELHHGNRFGVAMPGTFSPQPLLPVSWCTSYLTLSPGVCVQLSSRSCDHPARLEEAVEKLRGLSAVSA